MFIQLEMGPGYRQVVEELGLMGRAVKKACSEGLKQGVKIAAGRVISDYLSGQALKSRTGFLARAVDSWMEGELDGVVGVKANSAVDAYKWLLTDEQKTITPKKGKFLTIPIGENLTGAGRPRYSSPRQVPDGFFVKTKGRLLFGYKKGKKGKFRALFVLVKSVFVQGSGALYDGVIDSEDGISNKIQAEIDKVT